MLKLISRLPTLIGGKKTTMTVLAVVLVVLATIYSNQAALSTCFLRETDLERILCLMTSNTYATSSPETSDLSIPKSSDSGMDREQSQMSAKEAINSAFQTGILDWKRSVPTTDLAQ
jgi:hypothetical protein